MLDIKFIRENLDIVKAGAKKKRLTVDLDRLLVVDTERRALKTALEAALAKQNKASEEFPSASPERKVELQAEMKLVKEEVVGMEEKLKPITVEW
jgi:seryl-tRNA synthetase